MALKTVHLSPIGHEIEWVDGKAFARRVHRRPTETLCGLKVATGARETVADHEDPMTCRGCLQGLLKRKTVSVQPVMW